MDGQTDAERQYMAGRNDALSAMLSFILQRLDVDDPRHQHLAWIQERQEIVMHLRELCAAFGDNDWEDTLQLGDVIEKHLSRNMMDGHFYALRTLCINAQTLVNKIDQQDAEGVQKYKKHVADNIEHAWTFMSEQSLPWE